MKNGKSAKFAIAITTFALFSAISPSANAVACNPVTSTFTGNGTNGTSNAIYTVLKFTTVATCDWTVPSNVLRVDALIIGGGGGGGVWVAGGGGAGAMIDTTTISVTPNAVMPIVVGGGGTGSVLDISLTSTPSSPANGGDSSFNGIVASGGGRGGSWSTAATNGGSGGGGTGYTTAVGATTNSLYGNSGGTGTGDGANYGYPAGGGGGAGGSGNNASNANSGNGGLGKPSSITGTSVTYAGGGGGGCHGLGTNACVIGTGGSGIGGDGDGFVNTTHKNTTGGTGAANTGSGGGGAGGPNNGAYSPAVFTGGNGGSGVVIIRYISDFAVSPSLGTGKINNTTVAYRTSTQIQFTPPISGKITFLQKGKPISGCKNLNITAGNTITCNWKPAGHGQIPITINVYQTGSTSVFKSYELKYAGQSRTGSR